MGVLETLRQLQHPKEFRIEAAELWSGVAALLEALNQPVVSSARVPDANGAQARMMADVGTGLWRLRQKMLKPGSTQPLEEMRKPYRHLESVWDALGQAGVEIHDYTDRPFDQGLSLKVIAYQPTPGLSRQRIIETIKPSIYLRGDMLQIGEVIVGTPEGTH